MTRERLLVLAKAAPELSKKYEHTILAGITENGNLRRIYQSHGKYFGGTVRKKFSTKSWIEYELISDKPSDRYPEIRKIDFGSIRLMAQAKFKDIESLLNEQLTTVENFMEVYNFNPIPNEHYQELVTREEQKNLFGNDIIKIDIPEIKYQYIYRDDDDSTCHEMLCEDREVAELYRNCKKYLKPGKYKSEEEVHQKVRRKCSTGRL